ncbi:MAG: hypothetical protein ACOYM3_26865, partial [Terrimicrobiaceae bacterium]
FDSGTFNALALLSESENLSVFFCFIVKSSFGFACPCLFIHHLHRLQIAPSPQGLYGRCHDMFP